VDISEGERLALREGLMFFETSAKTNENIRKMFYSAIAELSFFEQFNKNKDSLIDELEEENETKISGPILQEPTTNNGNNINVVHPQGTKRSFCRC
jgi:hypothetical protein